MTMARILAFLLALCCCAGCLAHTGLTIQGQSNQVSFSQEVCFGDPAALDGRRFTASIRCSDHMLWNTEYRFSALDFQTDTQFLFTQEPEEYVYQGLHNDFFCYNNAGFGASTTSSMDIRQDTEYGRMLLELAQQIEPGETGEFIVDLSDYVRYHAITYNLYYQDSHRTCDEYLGNESLFTTSFDGSITQLDFDSWIQENHLYSYQVLNSLFQFPVLPGEMVRISLQKNSQGEVCELNYFLQEEDNQGLCTSIELIGHVTDQGLYLIPQAWNMWSPNQLLHGEYAQGPGVYFIPWKTVQDSVQRFDSDGASLECVTLDGENAVNIYPLPQDAYVLNLRVEADGSAVWMLSLEEGRYHLTRLDLTTNEITHRLDLMEADSADHSSVYSTWYWKGNTMVITSYEQLALVTLMPEPQLVLCVPYDDVRSGLIRFQEETGAIFYDGQTLILADRLGYADAALEVVALDASGALYWGQYRSSLFDCNEPYWENPGVYNADIGVTIQ